jgi:DNA-binding NtrC family response regulator
MPKLNGHELCTKLIQINPELEVILMSAYDSLECDTSKFTIIKKPILMAQLLQIVRDILARENTHTIKVKRKHKHNVIYNVKSLTF